MPKIETRGLLRGVYETGPQSFCGSRHYSIMEMEIADALRSIANRIESGEVVSHRAQIVGETPHRATLTFEFSEKFVR